MIIVPRLAISSSEVRVLRGPGDFQVELEVGPDRIATLLHRRGHGIERRAHLPQVGRLRRCAARLAASVSMPMRSSSTAITSRSVANCSAAS